LFTLVIPIPVQYPYDILTSEHFLFFPHEFTFIIYAFYTVFAFIVYSNETR